MALAGCFAGAPADEDGATRDPKLPPSQVDAGVETEKPGRLEGTVTDEAGTPLAGAVLTLDGAVDVHLEASSDAAGKFVFDGLPNGTYALVAEKTGFAPAQYPFVLAPGETKAVELVLEALEIEAPAEIVTIELDGFIKCAVHVPFTDDDAGEDQLLLRPCFAHSEQEATLLFEVRAGAKSVLAEVTWTKVQTSTTEQLFLKLEVEAGGGSFQTVNETQGGSPGRLRADEPENPGDRFYPADQPQMDLTWRLDAFAPRGVVSHAVVDQPFHLVVRVFYNATAPGDEVAWTPGAPSASRFGEADGAASGVLPGARP